MVQCPHGDQDLLDDQPMVQCPQGDQNLLDDRPMVQCLQGDQDLLDDRPMVQCLQGDQCTEPIVQDQVANAIVQGLMDDLVLLEHPGLLDHLRVLDDLVLLEHPGLLDNLRVLDNLVLLEHPGLLDNLGVLDDLVLLEHQPSHLQDALRTLITSALTVSQRSVSRLSAVRVSTALNIPFPILTSHWLSVLP